MDEADQPAPATEAPAALGAPAATVGPPTREYRATLTFAIAAAFLVLALFLGGSSLTYVGSGSAILLAAVLGITVNAVAAWGLSNGRDWARYAMAPMLWIYVISGAVLFVVALLGRGLHIPVGGILAAWALYAKPSEAFGPVPASSPQGTLLFAGAFVTAVLSYL